MKKIKIGQIGVCHEHASAIMDALRGMPDTFEVVGVVDDRDIPAIKFRGGCDLSPYEGLPWLSEEKLFAIPGLRAIAVETPNMELVPTALRCMERGLHIHMDKPAGDNLPLFQELLDGCRGKGLVLQLGYMLRSNPAVQFCQQAIRQGWLGDVFQIQGDMNHSYGRDVAYQRYLGSLKGGITFNLGCHLIDLIVSLMGRPENVIAFPKSTAGVDPGTNNNGLTVLDYPNAAATVRSCGLAVDGISRRRLTICGTKGTFDLCPLEVYDGTPLRASLILIDGNDAYPAGTHVVEFEPMTDRYQPQLLELARLINGEIENPHTYAHDYLVHEVVLAASGYTKWDRGK